MSKNFLSRYSPWIVLTIALYASAFIYLFIENFVFSSSLDLMNFREIDDYAFQLYIRQAHENRQFFRLNGYAYGWIFWFPIVCITYPFYFLSIYFGIDTPLAVIPRQLSLFFTMGTAVILYRIASLYTKDNFIKSLILLLYLSFPVTGYFALRFGTVSQTMFLSALSYYLTARKEFLTQKDLYIIAVAVAAAAATKLSALLITPLITLVILDRLSWKIKENFVPLIKSFFVFLFSLAALSQIPPKAVIAQIKMTQTNFGQDFGVFRVFLYGIVFPNLHIIIFLVTFLCLVYKAIIALRDDRNFYKRDYLYIFLALIISIVYLVLTIKMGTMYISIYFTVISFLLPLGVLAFEHINIYLRHVIGVVFLATSIFLNFDLIFSSNLNNRPWNTYSVKAADPATIRDLSIREVLKAKLKNPDEYKDKLKILRDCQVPSPYSSLRRNVIETCVFGNIDVVSGKQEYDLIGLYKKDIAFITDSEFNDLIKKVDSKIALQYKNHRKAVNDFLLKKQFNNVNYQLLLENEDYLYYVSNSLELNK